MQLPPAAVPNEHLYAKGLRPGLPAKRDDRTAGGGEDTCHRRGHGHLLVHASYKRLRRQRYRKLTPLAVDRTSDESMLNPFFEAHACRANQWRNKRPLDQRRPECSLIFHSRTRTNRSRSNKGRHGVRAKASSLRAVSWWTERGSDTLRRAHADVPPAGPRTDLSPHPTPSQLHRGGASSSRHSVPKSRSALSPDVRVKATHREGQALGVHRLHLHVHSVQEPQ